MVGKLECLPFLEDKMDFKYKKKLGQNFLQDEGILKKIADSVEVKKDDLIIEIGPGQGALTKYLVQKGCDVLAFEIDLDTKNYLDKITATNLKIIYRDFMQIDLLDYINKEYKNIYVIANIPYYITTPIIEKLIKSKITINSMVLLVQKEVATRFAAGPGSSDYGSISVYLNYYFKIKKLFDVSRKCFKPEPNVDSAVIKLEAREMASLKDEKVMWKLVKDAFQFKRKNLKNNWRDYDLNKIKAVLIKYELNLNCRAEELPLEVFEEIANNL